MRLAVVGMIIIKSFVMSIEELAEDYLAGLGNDELEDISNEKISIEDIQDWLDAVEETCDDIKWLRECIIEYAGSYLHEYKQDRISDFRGVLDEAIRYSTDGLKDLEVGLILLEYANDYLKLEYLNE